MIREQLAENTMNEGGPSADTGTPATRQDSPDVHGWRPIETAAKGELIDIWTVGWGAEPHRVADCYYDLICGEWRTSRPAGQLLCINERYVTHWRPLPAPPVLP